MFWDQLCILAQDVYVFKIIGIYIYLMGCMSLKSSSKVCHHYEDTYFNYLSNKEKIPVL